MRHPPCNVCATPQVLGHCAGVPLSLEQLTSALVNSELLFLTKDHEDDPGRFELEGELSELKLPQNLFEAIHMRLRALALRDPELHLLVMAAAAMDGVFTMTTMTPVWLVLSESSADCGGEQVLRAAVIKGLEQGLLKCVEGEPSNTRRRSTASAGMDTRFTFRHLKIQDCVLESMPSATKRSLHAACASGLRGPSIPHLTLDIIPQFSCLPSTMSVKYR